MSEFDGISGFDGWKKKLDELLAEARKAAGANDEKGLVAIADRLTEFTIESWPDTPEIKALDKIAGETATRLRKQGIEGKLDAIAARSAEVGRLAQGFDQAATANAAKAASIRLTRTREVLDTATSTVDTLKRFRETLKSGDDGALIAEVNQIVESLETLRKSVGSGKT
jgi:hypothetical protein